MMSNQSYMIRRTGNGQFEDAPNNDTLVASQACDSSGRSGSDNAERTKTGSRAHEDEIGCNDVLCGRGGLTNHHPGNMFFRRLVRIKQENYLQANKRDKAQVAREIVEIIRGLTPAGRFLRKDPADDGYWVEIGDRRAREKTSQALREGAPELREELNVENDKKAAAAAAVAAEAEKRNHHAAFGTMCDGTVGNKKARKAVDMKLNLKPTDLVAAKFLPEIRRYPVDLAHGISSLPAAGTPLLNVAAGFAMPNKTGRAPAYFQGARLPQITGPGMVSFSDNITAPSIPTASVAAQLPDFALPKVSALARANHLANTRAQASLLLGLHPLNQQVPPQASIPQTQSRGSTSSRASFLSQLAMVGMAGNNRFV